MLCLSDLSGVGVTMRPSNSDHERQRAGRRTRIQRNALRQIYLPMAMAVIVILALSILLWALPGDAGDNVVIILLLLCPAAVLLLVAYLVMVALLLGLVEGHRRGLGGLESVNQIALKARNLTLKTADRANAASIRFNSAFAPASKAMNSAFSPEPEVGPGKTKTDGRHDSAKESR